MRPSLQPPLGVTIEPGLQVKVIEVPTAITGATFSVGGGINIQKGQAPVRICLCVIRFGADGRVICGEGSAKTAEIQEDVAGVAMGFCVVRVDEDSGFVRTKGLIEAAEVPQYITAVIVQQCKIRLDVYGQVICGEGIGKTILI